MSFSRRQWLVAAAMSASLHGVLFVSLHTGRQAETMAEAASSQFAVGVVSTASLFQDGEVDAEAVETVAELESETAPEVLVPVERSSTEAAARSTRREATDVEASRDAVSPPSSRVAAVTETVDVDPRASGARAITSQTSPLSATPAAGRIIESSDPERAANVPTDEARALEPTSKQAAVRPVERAQEPEPREVVPVVEKTVIETAPIEAEVEVTKKRQAAKPKKTARKKTARKSSASRASQGGGGASGQSRTVSGRGAMTSYLGLVSARLHREKRYPVQARSRGIEGTAVVSFTIDSKGRVVRSRLIRSSGQGLLDREVLAMLDRAGPFPPIPASVGRSALSLSVPIEFSVR